MESTQASQASKSEQAMERARRILDSEICALFNEADQAVIKHLHLLILQANLPELESFLRQFKDNQSYLSAIIHSVNQHLSRQLTGVCLSIMSSDAICVNEYHGESALIISTKGNDTRVMRLRTEWDGAVSVDLNDQRDLPQPELLLKYLATQALVRLLVPRKETEALTEDGLPAIAEE